MYHIIFPPNGPGDGDKTKGLNYVARPLHACCRHVAFGVDTVARAVQLRQTFLTGAHWPTIWFPLHFALPESWPSLGVQCEGIDLVCVNNLHMQPFFLPVDIKHIQCADSSSWRDIIHCVNETSVQVDPRVSSRTTR